MLMFYRLHRQGRFRCAMRKTDHHWSDRASFPLQASQRQYYTHHSTNKGHDVQALSKYNHKMYSYHDPFNYKRKLATYILLYLRHLSTKIPAISFHFFLYIYNTYYHNNTSYSYFQDLLIKKYVLLWCTYHHTLFNSVNILNLLIA